MVDTPETRAREVERLHRAGKSHDAFELALESAQRFPRSSLALTNLGYFHILRGEPAEALHVYEAALRANPQNAEARRGLAVAKTQCGIAARGDSTTSAPFRGTGTPVRVLVPITLEAATSSPSACSTIGLRGDKLAVELHPPGEPLPPHDVVFNAVGEADSSADALRTTRMILAATNKRVLNDPDSSNAPDVWKSPAPRRHRRCRRPADRFGCSPRRAGSLPDLFRAPGFHWASTYSCGAGGRFGQTLEQCPASGLRD